MNINKETLQEASVEPDAFEADGVPVFTLDFRESGRARLCRSGPQALNLAELLAVVLGLNLSKGSQRRCLTAITSRYDSPRRLAAAEFVDFLTIPGMTPRRAEILAACLEVGRRVRQERPDDRPRLRSGSEVYGFVRDDLQTLEVEAFEVLSLDAKNRLIRRDRVSRGTLTGSLVHPREVFKAAVEARAAAIVVTHNHPSGDPAPSPEDLAITDRLIAAGEILGIRILDHVIVGDGRYISLAEAGLMLASKKAFSSRA